MTLASRSRILDQLKWAEYIGVSIVAQFLLFPHVEGEVLEGNLLSGVDCVIQGFHDVIDFLVAGIDAPPYQSGAIDVRSRSISKHGSSSLRRTVFLVMSTILKQKPLDEPVYQFMDKKRAEGKPYKVYMMTSANKFLRVYYATVRNYLDSLEAE